MLLEISLAALFAGVSQDYSDQAKATLKLMVGQRPGEQQEVSERVVAFSRACDSMFERFLQRVSERETQIRAIRQ